MPNSLSHITEGFVYWADQAVAHCKKKSAWDEFKVNKDKCKYFTVCREEFAHQLSDLYGRNREEKLLSDIITGHTKALRRFLLATGIGLGFYERESRELIDRVNKLVPNKRKFTQLLQEEIELEIEFEKEEEMQLQRPPQAAPCKNKLDKDVECFCLEPVGPDPSSASFVSLGDSLKRSSLGKQAGWHQAWSSLVRCTRDFVQTVVEDAGNMNDDYLAWPRWLVHAPHKTPQLLVLSDFEANSLWTRFTSENKHAKLYLFSPRIHREQRKRLFPRNLCMSRVDEMPHLLIEELAIFAGSLYFADTSELDAYLDIIGYCPTPRSAFHQTCFDKQLIENGGFVKPDNRLAVFESEEKANASKYDADPSECIVKLLIIRHFAVLPASAHQLVVLRRGERPSNLPAKKNHNFITSKCSYL